MRLPKILNYLEKNGLGKRPLKIIQDRASKAVMGGENLSEDGMGVFYKDFWKTRIDDEVQERLATDWGQCENEDCGSPILDEEVGGYKGNYCTRECRDEAEEYYRECHACGDGFDSEYEGGWMEWAEEYFCTNQCAWNYIKRYYDFERQGFDEDTSIKQLQRHSDQAPWYESERQIERDLDRYGVRIMECQGCGTIVNEDELVRVADIDDGEFCSEACAWEAIGEYAEGEGLNPEEIKTLKQKPLRDLSDNRELDYLIAEILDQREDEDEGAE